MAAQTVKAARRDLATRVVEGAVTAMVGCEAAERVGEVWEVEVETQVAVVENSR